MIDLPDLNPGDYVFVTHQCPMDDRQRYQLDKPTTIYVVENPRDPTDNVRVDGTPVGYYVRLRPVKGSDPKRPAEGYHRENVMLLTP